MRGDKIQILRDDAQHIGRNELRQGMGDGRHIQVQRAKQRADKNQQRKDGKQQIIRQRRTVTGHIVGIVTTHHRRGNPAESGARTGSDRFHQSMPPVLCSIPPFGPNEKPIIDYATDFCYEISTKIVVKCRKN